PLCRIDVSRAETSGGAIGTGRRSTVSCQIRELRNGQLGSTLNSVRCARYAPRRPPLESVTNELRRPPRLRSATRPDLGVVSRPPPACRAPPPRGARTECVERARGARVPAPGHRRVALHRLRLLRQ